MFESGVVRPTVTTQSKSTVLLAEACNLVLSARDARRGADEAKVDAAEYAFIDLGKLHLHERESPHLGESRRPVLCLLSWNGRFAWSL